jgi:hypothetical protein
VLELLRLADPLTFTEESRARGPPALTNAPTAKADGVYCLETSDCGGLFQTRPDLLVKRGKEVVQVIDTQWKRIASRIDDPKLGVSQADVSDDGLWTLYGCSLLTLLYPHHVALGGCEGIVAAHKVTASDHTLAVATTDVAQQAQTQGRLRNLVFGLLTYRSLQSTHVTATLTIDS